MRFDYSSSLLASLPSVANNVVCAVSTYPRIYAAQRLPGARTPSSTVNVKQAGTNLQRESIVTCPRLLRSAALPDDFWFNAIKRNAKLSY